MTIDRMTIDLEAGISGRCECTVVQELTALNMGSGDLEVYATPAMIALMEKAAVECVQGRLPEGCTTVGGHIDVRHLKPTIVGERVRAEAVLEAVEGKKLKYTVRAWAGEVLIGEGKHLRFIVRRADFVQV